MIHVIQAWMLKQLANMKMDWQIFKTVHTPTAKKKTEHVKSAKSMFYTLQINLLKMHMMNGHTINLFKCIQWMETTIKTLQFTLFTTAIWSFRLCLVPRKFMGKCEVKKIERKRRNIRKKYIFKINKLFSCSAWIRFS